MKKIILLIGQKGSGKSFVGSLIEEKFGIRFIRVEDWAIKVKRGRNINDYGYLTDVFNVIENGIRNELRDYETICFESLGLSNQFDEMVENLEKHFKLITIKILCDSEQCVERIRLRDQSMHVNVSDNQIREINEKVSKRNYRTNYTILNNTLSKDYLVDEIKKILIKSKVAVKSQNS